MIRSPSATGGNINFLCIFRKQMRKESVVGQRGQVADERRQSAGAAVAAAGQLGFARFRRRRAPRVPAEQGIKSARFSLTLRASNHGPREQSSRMIYVTPFRLLLPNWQTIRPNDSGLCLPPRADRHNFAQFALNKEETMSLWRRHRRTG